MWEIIGYILGVIVVVIALVAGTALVVMSIGVGVGVGVFSGAFVAIKNYFIAINEEIEHPLMRWLLNISLGICSLAIFGALVMLLLSIVL